MSSNKFRENIQVSALVSTYDSEQFIEGCLADLVEQSLYQQGLLEIIVIDCASPANEAAYCRSFQEKYKNISYIRLSERETLYGAWNIGVQAANGKYLTNANTDDRHHFQALERMYRELENNSTVDLVYADVYSSKVPNEIFPQNNQLERFVYKHFSAADVLTAYQFGCQPLWRKSVHEKIGLFNRELKAAGDYEFNWRFNLAGLKAVHIPEPLGLFLERDQSISRANSTSTDEQQMLRQKYINVENILKLYQLDGWAVTTNFEQAAIFANLKDRATQLELPWHPGQSFRDNGIIAMCDQVLGVLGQQVPA